jgi:hypothetical protein
MFYSLFLRSWSLHFEQCCGIALAQASAPSVEDIPRLATNLITADARRPEPELGDGRRMAFNAGGPGARRNAERA